MGAVLQVVEAPATAATLLNPARRRILELLSNPESASGLARRLGMPRQVVNYHLKDLETAGLVALVEERRKGNCIERLMRATAQTYVIAPTALGKLGADPAAVADKLSASYLVAVAARIIRDLGRLRARKLLPTLTLESEVRFRSATDRSAFTQELSEHVAQLVAKYHDEKAEGGRRFRLVMGAYPAIEEHDSANSNQTA